MSDPYGPVKSSPDDQRETPIAPGGPRHASRKPGSAEPSSPWRGLLRPRSVRAKVVAVLMVPVVSLLALWAYATVTTVQDVAAQRNFQKVNATVLTPLREFVEAAQAERTAASSHLGGDASAADRLTSAGERTTSATEALEDGVTLARTTAAELDRDVPAMMDAALDSAGGIAPLRESVLAREVTWDEAYDEYTAAIESALGLQAGLSGVPVPDDASDPHIVQELAYGREMVARADAVMAAASAAGTMTTRQYAELSGAATASEAFLAVAPELQPGDAAAYRSVAESEAYAALRGFIDTIVAAGPGDAAAAAVAGPDWGEAADVVLTDLAAAEDVTTARAVAEPEFFASDLLGTAGLVVALGLVGVILSLLVSVYIGRGLLVELVGLRNSAMDLAARKLPNALRRLNAGDKVDIDTEAPRVAHAGDEVSQVNEALNAVHRAALNAAIERSHVVSGISNVYVYLARRSQVLLHRQLGLLDAMERRTEDPQDLEDLFRLDHLTTRMRRQAESLIILSGASPARRWKYPVPAIDVVRAAVAEVEDFTRVDVQDLPDVRVSGASVADLTHLVAELVENAVTFSPPHTKALVRGQLVGSGLAVEIEDRGLGMSAQALADANKRVQDAGQVDLLDADQLGLFVVNRLAHRQKVKVTLQRSPYGGVTAVVLIPDRLLDHDSVQVNHFTPTTAGSGQPAGVQRRESPWQVITPGTGSAPSSNGSAPEAVPVPAEVAASGGPGDDSSGGDRLPVAGGEGVSAGDERLSSTEDLPRRVRQANLAPELRDEAHEGAAPTAPSPPGRTPEQARATLESLRSGWLRGRKQDR